MARPRVKTAKVLRVGLAVVMAFAVTTVGNRCRPQGGRPDRSFRARELWGMSAMRRRNSRVLEGNGTPGGSNPFAILRGAVHFKRRIA